VGVVDALRLLLDDRALVQVGRDKVRGGTDLERVSVQEERSGNRSGAVRLARRSRVYCEKSCLASRPCASHAAIMPLRQPVLHNSCRLAEQDAQHLHQMQRSAHIHTSSWIRGGSHSPA
jgi:hypothetical protein